MFGGFQGKVLLFCGFFPRGIGLLPDPFGVDVYLEPRTQVGCMRSLWEC